MFRHKFLKDKDCCFIKKNQQETYDFVCKYCGETLAEIMSIYDNNNSIINEYIIRCKLLTCVNNYNGYYYSKYKENELKSVLIWGKV